MFKNPKIAVMAPIWNYYPVIVGSMMAQTHQRWELHLIHDGPISDSWSGKIKNTVESAEDHRIDLVETHARQGRWGHPLRRKWLEDIRERDDIDLIVITNADNYHTPIFLQALARTFRDCPDEIVASYCSLMSHNYFGYSNTQVKLECAGVDIAAMMFSRAAACEIGWESDEHAADWHFINGIINKYGKKMIAKVEGNLVVHN